MSCIAGVGLGREGRARFEVDSAELSPAGFAEVEATVVSTRFWLLRSPRSVGTSGWFVAGLVST